MKALNNEIRNSRILYFWVCYAGVVVLLGISIYLNLSKIPELANERTRSTEMEITKFLVEIRNLDDYVKRLSSKNPSAGQLQTIFGFISQLKASYNKPIFQAVLKSYEVLLGDLGNTANIQDDELKQLTDKYNQLAQQKQELEQKLQQMKQERSIP